jgi:hypothetical protein
LQEHSLLISNQEDIRGIDVILMLVNGRDDVEGSEGVMRCGSLSVFSCKDWVTMIRQRG